MKDNCYAYAIDLSLRKGKNGEYSEPLIFEYQPLLSSNLGGSSGWSYKNALEKAFPNSDITINTQGKRLNIRTENPVRRILIKNSEELSMNDFIRIQQGKYTHIHTGSFEAEIDQLNNKVYQRLYLPDQVSPEYRILESKVEPEKLVKDISNYFSNKNISKIVLKSAISHEGQGNFFIDITDQAALSQGIRKIQKLNINSKYFLAEEQKEFPRVSRKTGEEKPDHLTYRLVGIANVEGDVNHFIATKSISSSLDSHQRGRMKCYFNEPGKTHQNKAKWMHEACGPKDKYFGIGDNKIAIDPALMNKISKNMYQLYADIKSMPDEEFEQHIDELVIRKNALSSKEEKIAQFSIKEKPEKELVNSANLMTFERTTDAYPPLAAAIATEMVKTNTIDLTKLAELSGRHEDLEPFLNAMSRKKKFDSLQTATIDQLTYCLENYAHHTDLSRQAKHFLTEKKTQILKTKPTTSAKTEEKSETASYYASRLQQAFFNEPCGSKAEYLEPKATEEATNDDKKSIHRLAKLALFTTTSEDESKKTEEKLTKSSFASKKGVFN